MLRKPKLNNAHILIADHDVPMAGVLQRILKDLGLSNVTFVKNGREAIEKLRNDPIDLLITEWDIEPLDGINLIKTMRHSEDPYFAMMPILMLTGRATAEDVVLARDIGVNEFLIKPYTSKTLFNRLEHIIDFPRHFIISDIYTGPDRRRKMEEVDNDRRATEPETYLDLDKIKPQKGKIIKLLPQNALRKKMGLMGSLKDLITPAMLSEAQSYIESMRDESMSWISEDMDALEKAMHAIVGGIDCPDTLEFAKTSLLSIKSRAGTFNYKLASDVAYELYKFIRHEFVLGDMRHHLIVQKYVEGIKILLAKRVIGEGTEQDRALIVGLHLLMDRLSR